MTKFESVTQLFAPERTENNSTEFCVDGPNCLSMLLEEIKKARHFIHVQVMLIYSDEAGVKVSQALAEKAREGVEVRIMCDSDMSSIVRVIEKVRSSGTSDFSDIKAMFDQAGVKFVASDKESYRITNWDEEREKMLRKGVPEEFVQMQDAIQDAVQLNANVFDHRKVFIFDGVSAVHTSMNIGNKYLYQRQPNEDQSNMSGDQWHDGAMLIKGPAVSELNKKFASKWMVRGGDVFDYHRHFREKESYGTDAVTVFDHFPGMKQNPIRDYYLHKIKTCKGRFIIENPYINDEGIWHTLASLPKEQAQKITIINPYKAKGNDYPQNESAIKCTMWKPFRQGVNFYQYSHRMSHLKVALDEEASEVFYGSYNLNHRSALHDFELNVRVESKQLAESVKKELEKDLSLAKKITDASEFYEHPNRHPSCLLLFATDYFE